MTRPPTIVSGNERRPPISAAASTVTVSDVPLPTETPMIGARTPASPAQGAADTPVDGSDPPDPPAERGERPRPF